MSTTTTTTEISSNSNSSCRLLICLNILPFHDQRVFRSQLSHIELLRLSACCHSLRSSIRNDRALWQELYHRDFLSGVYYAKEMDFVLWCICTDVNNPCTSDKRADLLENVDWYNTYRRRVSTENNWRYGRCNTTRIDMEHDKDGVCYSIDADNHRIFITQRNRSAKTPGHNYTFEYLPHSDLRVSNNIVYNSTFSTSPNVLSLGSGNETKDDYVTGDHYIAIRPDVFENNTNYNVRILSRKHGGIFTTFDVPVPYRMKTVEGKWALLVDKSQVLVNDSQIYKTNIIVFDIDNSIMCPGSVDDTWSVACFYKTTNNTAIVYTARVVGYRMDRIEWALYQFSSNNPVVQLRSGWFELPIKIPKAWLEAYNSYDSYMIIKLLGNYYYNPYIIHNVASNGQSHTPRNCYTVSDQHIPIPLLRAGYTHSIFGSSLAKVWTDLTYNDDQVLQIQGTISIKHIIGDLYEFLIRDHNYEHNRLLVDISTKEIIRELEVSNIGGHLRVDTMLGTIGSSHNQRMQVLYEYGEL